MEIRRRVEPLARSRAFVLLAAELAVLAAFAILYDAYDFHVYALGGQAVLGHDRLYEYQWRGHGFTYPPCAALGFLPLAQLPLPAARFVWDAASVAALILAVRATYGLAGRRPDAATVAGTVAGCLLLEPVWHTFFLGQINLLLLAAVLLDLQRIAGGRTGGIGIGLASALKLTPAVFIVLLVFAGRRRSAGLAVVSALAASVAGAVAAPRASWEYWTHYVTDVGRVGSLTYASNQSLDALLHRADRPGGWLLAAVAVGLAGVVAAAVLARRGDWLAAAAGTGVAGLLVSPISWSHHWVWAIPALAVLLRDGRLRAAAAAGTVFVVAPIWWPLVTPTGWPAVVQRDAYALTGLVFLGYLVAGARRQLRAAEPRIRATVLAR